MVPYKLEKILQVNMILRYTCQNSFGFAWLCFWQDTMIMTLNRSCYLEFVPRVRMRTSFHPLGHSFGRQYLISTCYLTNCHGQMTLQPLEEHKTHLTRSHRGQMSLEQTWFQECLFHVEKEVWNWVTVLVADHPIASKFSFAPGEFWAGDPHTTEEGLKVYVCTIGESLSICWTSVVLNKSFAVEQCETLPIVWCFHMGFPIV